MPWQGLHVRNTPLRVPGKADNVEQKWSEINLQPHQHELASLARPLLHVHLMDVIAHQAKTMQASESQPEKFKWQNAVCNIVCSAFTSVVYSE